MTPYAFSYVLKQFNNAPKVVLGQKNNSSFDISHQEGCIVTATTLQCIFPFYKVMQLPCRHIFAVRKRYMSLYEPSLCAVRWRKDYISLVIVCFVKVKNHHHLQVQLTYISYLLTKKLQAFFQHKRNIEKPLMLLRSWLAWSPKHQ